MVEARSVNNVKKTHHHTDCAVILWFNKYTHAHAHAHTHAHANRLAWVLKGEEGGMTSFLLVCWRGTSLRPPFLAFSSPYFSPVKALLFIKLHITAQSGPPVI